MEAQAMPGEPIEQRLERIVEELRQAVLRKPGQPGRDDWRRTIGMFANDPIAKEIIDEALKIREEERQRARDDDSRLLP
jgi:hypothetical protein